MSHAYILLSGLRNYLIRDGYVGALKEHLKQHHTFLHFSCGAREGVSMCTGVEQALSFHALFLFYYLCRAARGSADIPILPHAHTILLKHAVNLKRKRTLFTSKRLFHHPIVLPTSRCNTNVGFSQNSGEAVPWEIALRGVMCLQATLQIEHYQAPYEYRQYYVAGRMCISVGTLH